VSISDPTPDNLRAAADAFDAAYDSDFPHHTSVILRAAAKRIEKLEEDRENLRVIFTALAKEL